MKEIWKKIAIGAGVVLVLLGISYGFVPQVLQGKIVNQSDISGYVGMSHEMNTWNKEHPDDPTYWTDSMFGGMPTTAISTQNGGDYTQVLYDLLFAGKRPATYLFVALLGAFLLFLALGVSWPLALGGAVAIAFCSYNFQIIQVGHNTKMQAIALMPWVLAALVYTYKSKRPWQMLLGSVLFALALSMQIKANHQQITYYLAIMVLLYALVELIGTIRDKCWKGFIKASLLLLLVGGAGIATNVNKLLPLAKYTPNTMRGGSELSGSGNNAKGLDLDYATAWSYGWEELPNLMIPDFNGGASAGAVNPDKSETIKLLKRAGQRNLKETAKSLPLYWGPQPFTAGPMYMGAITVFLFVLGLFLYRKREKWWLVAACVIAIFMALGSHFMPFTAFCFKYLPLYNKFRTVSMALVVLQVALPVLGILTLDGIVKEKYNRKDVLKANWWALGITGGFSLLCCLFPGLFGSFSGASDAQMQDVLVDALVKDRVMLFRHDAFVSLAYILASSLLILWGFTKNGRKQASAIGICALVLVNMFLVGKRYLNADHFTTPKDFNKPFTERPVDKIILADEDPQYRVLDLTVNVFNSSVPSYHHKNVGGYSPAKLQRYQDLIEKYLSAEINGLYKAMGEVETMEDFAAHMAAQTPVLNALNTRYVVVDPNFPPVVNDAAYGPAWFVTDYVTASTPDEEIALIGRVDLKTTAVLSREIPDQVGDDEARTVGDDEAASLPATTGNLIDMVSYAPNRLKYHYTAPSEALAVFSEIYYPDGWHATVDGEPLELLRADWTLRAALLPAGEHDVEMYFLPYSYSLGADISRASSILLILLLLGAIAGAVMRTRSSAKKA
ncbi:MAG: YfhO family protein [Bacteroidales bacterium]|nr:YfhO family protein [Bacteroidales bacterium]